MRRRALGPDSANLSRPATAEHRRKRPGQSSQDHAWAETRARVCGASSCERQHRGSKDVFVHISAVERAGLGTLVEGQKVSYDVVTERGKQAAGNLKAA